jgi:hypothetical protein
MLPDLDRADRIGEFWGYPQSHAFVELLTAMRTGPYGRCSWNAAGHGRLSAGSISIRDLKPPLQGPAV